MFAGDLTYAYPTILNPANPLSKQSSCILSIYVNSQAFLLRISYGENFLDFKSKKSARNRTA